MKNAQQRIPYAKDLTPKNSLTKEYLDHLAHLEHQDLEASRAKTKASRPTLQMSIRIREDAYFAFRALCRATRKTNGEMVIEPAPISTGHLGLTKEA